MPPSALRTLYGDSFSAFRENNTGEHGGCKAENNADEPRQQGVDADLEGKKMPIR